MAPPLKNRPYKNEQKKFKLKPVISELNRLGTKANIQLHKRIYKNYGTFVMDEDWDNLLILDACRFDMFESINTLSGDLQKRRSLGSESWEFLQANFDGKSFHDTVYITANPHASKLPSGTFHDVVNLLEEDWDTQLGTVRPNAVIKAILQAQNDYPNKRLIAHFMQPHYPFIGECGRKLAHKGITIHLSNDDQGSKERKIWTRLREGHLGKDQVWNAYCENLDIVLDHVENLLKSLTGTSVITSDHGNLVGEIIYPIPVRGYGHPPGLYVDELRIVPWFVVEGSERRSIVAETPAEQDELSSEIVEDRLRNLGYQ